MNRNRWIFFVGLILGLLVLSYKSIPIPPSVADGISNQLIVKISEKLNKKYGLKLSAIGGAQEKEKLKSINVHYHYYGKPLSIDTGRILIVNVIEEYLQAINNDKELKPYLLKYPFTLSNLHLAIIVNTLDNKKYHHPNLDTIANRNNKIEYLTSEDVYTIVDEILEDYDKALEIVKKNHQLDIEK